MAALCSKDQLQYHTSSADLRKKNTTSKQYEHRNRVSNITVLCHKLTLMELSEEASHKPSVLSSFLPAVPKNQ